MTRTQALAASSPPMRVFLGVLLVESVISTATFAWNIAAILKRRNEYPA